MGLISLVNWTALVGPRQARPGFLAEVLLLDKCLACSQTRSLARKKHYCKLELEVL